MPAGKPHRNEISQNSALDLRLPPGKRRADLLNGRIEFPPVLFELPQVFFAGSN